MGTVMNDPQLLEAIERYLRGEMTPEEQQQFEALRKSNPDVDQLVVEHKFFLEQLEQYGNTRDFKNTLHDVHASLSEKGQIEAGKSPSAIVYLWNRYKRVAAIAACIAGITAIATSSLFNTIRPAAVDNDTKQELVSVKEDINGIKKDQKIIEGKIEAHKKKDAASFDMTVVYNGTGFLIDAKGLMITNAHVLKNSSNIYVQNNKGEKFRAIVVKLDVPRDMAIIKIDDDQFKGYNSLPYSIKTTSSDIAESIFTLGYPRSEIVYGEGYLSAKTGYHGDTLSCQVTVDANPGNSGGPIFNRNGEVIGILSAKQTDIDGAVFAVQSKYIHQLINELKKNNSLYKTTKIPSKSTLQGIDKVQQVKKLQDYVFMVKGDEYTGK
jgi:serine protease Do